MHSLFVPPTVSHRKNGGKDCFDENESQGPIVGGGSRLLSSCEELTSGAKDVGGCVNHSKQTSGAD